MLYFALVYFIDAYGKQPFIAHGYSVASRRTIQVYIVIPLPMSAISSRHAGLHCWLGD